MDDLLLLTATPDPPVNDNLANAVEITGASGSVGPYAIDSATVESGELGSLDQSMWFKFLALSTATGVYISTEGSAAGDADSGDGITPPTPYGSLDTHVIVWEVTTATPTFSDLFGHNIAANEDETADMTGAFWSDVTFNVTSGKWYFIQVGSAFGPGYTGTVQLNWTGLPTTATAMPSTTAGIGAVPAATAKGNATALPSATAGIGSVPAPTAIGTGAGVASPNVVAGIGAVPAPTATGGTAGTASPGVVAGIGRVLSPTVIGGHGATATPDTVAGTSRVPHPRGFGAGTGGGGGTTNGIYDFWSVKALG